MGHYKSNLRDIEFNLFEVLGRQEVLGHGPYGEIDADTAREMLHEMGRLAENELAASFTDGDRTPPTFDPETGIATMPESFTRSFRDYCDAEFWRIKLPESMGGTPAPPSLVWAMSELVLGANPAIEMYAAFVNFAALLQRLGTPEQAKLGQLMVDGRWGATMVLTEPDAGSDVGAGRTKAVQAEDGTWHITGVKRFITSGTSDFFDNVVHFVLARPEGAGPGTKGLSLFIVPSHHVDIETGEIGERNGVQVANIEDKMGLKVSTTCELRFGEDPNTPAVGTLLGEVHDGIAQMFKVIEYARMLVGTKAIATLSTGYLNALDYAKERVQGADMTQMADKTAPRVTITHHPDVRRSLMLQKSYAEGLRALVLFTASQQDVVEAADPAGDSEPQPGTAEDMANRINDLLLPIVKGCGSERAWALLGSESLQTYGGSGFLRDYPVEQYVRDAKIDSLYEGTTAIQAQDFFFRKVLRDKGEALQALGGQILATVTGAAAGEALATEYKLLGKALGEFQTMVETLTGYAISADPRMQGDPRQLYLVGQHTTRLLMAAGDLVVAWLLVRQAEVASAALAEGGKDADFYTGKVASAKFFVRTVLPRLSSDRAIVTHADNDLMDVPESAF